jgi:hypothetical protein
MPQLVPMRKVKQLNVINDHVIWFRFSDGREGYRDFSDMLAEGGEMVEPLRDPHMFRAAYVEDGVPTWPNGYAIDAINLYMEMDKARELGPRPNLPAIFLNRFDVLEVGLNEESEQAYINLQVGDRIARLAFDGEEAVEFLSTFSDVVDRLDRLRAGRRAKTKNNER